MSGDLKNYIEYRLSRADNTFNDAILLANSNSWNSCVNRLYYACFYAVSALLVQKGYNIKTPANSGLQPESLKRQQAGCTCDHS
jgi:uncharacterized protein